MLSAEENELFTRVGPGTPAGELLRRYWHPICPVSEITPEKPRKRVLLLGEQLVLYRDLRGTYGLVAERCSHRSASLYYGYVEEKGIRCPYHGWVYDEKGRCLEQPFEQNREASRLSFRHPAYPVQELGGLLFAYLGPEPVPLLPKWDVLARQDGERTVEVQPLLGCNWLQCQENSLDPTHTYYLHLRRMVEKGKFKGRRIRAPERYSFQEFPLGIVKRRVFGGDGDLRWEQLGHPAIFPNILRHISERPGASGDPTPEDIAASPIDLQFRVPVDDTHTQIFIIYFVPTAAGSVGSGAEKVTYISVRDEDGEFHLESFPSQDVMAWETQGPITDRTAERLGVADTGIVMWRKILREQIKIVQDGGDPMGVFRGAENEGIIDLGPSREWDGERFVSKPWSGWGNGKIWTSPNVSLDHKSAETT
jgi:5,5'-dehydrodivanillate O-demethylase